MSLFRFSIRVLLFVLALWLGGFAAFSARVLQTTPSLPEADGIVVLTGSSGRISAGLDLLNRRPGTKMLITGVGDNTKRQALANAFGITAAQFACCIELDRRAKDTVGNAEQTALWVRRNGLTSIVVVTAASHMPRSLVELRRMMPNIALMPLPTRAGDDDPSRWGQQFPAFRRFALEYNKYLFSLIRARLVDNIGDMRPA